MQYAKKLYIENFRCIDKLEISLNNMNIFVGRNNTGKTSIIEALTLILTSFKKYKDVLGEEILNTIRGSPEYLVKHNSEYANISLEFEDGVNTSMYMIKKPESAKKIPLKDIFIETYEQLLTTSAEEDFNATIRRLKRDIEYLTLKRETEYFTSERDIEYPTQSRVLHLRRKLEEMTKNKDNYIELYRRKLEEELRLAGVTLVNENILNSFLFRGHDRKIFYNEEILEAMEKKIGYVYIRTYRAEDLLEYLEENNIGALVDLLEILRKNVNYLVDYRRGLLLIRQNHGQVWVPARVVGDGLKALIEVVAPIYMGASYVIIEEPEIHMHPGYLNAYVNELLNALEKPSVQLFMTTHSIEFLDILLSKLSERGLLEKLNLIRLYRAEDGIDYEELNGEEALKERDLIKGDLRGI